MMYLLALVFGAIYSLGFAPYDLWPASCASIAGLFWLLHRANVRPVLIAWIFGIGKYAVGASWVYVSINVYGNAPPLLAALLVVLFVAVLSFLFCAPVGWLYAYLRSTISEQRAWSVSDMMAFSVAWLLADWLTTWLFTGFPWLLPGYAVMDTVLLAWAPVVGVLGTGLLLVLTSTALVCMLAQKAVKVRLALLFVLPWCVGFALGQVSWVEAGASKSVALVQGNIDQARKWLPAEAIPNVRKQLKLSADHWDADILMWSEAAVTMYPQQAQSLLENLGQQGMATNTDVVVGMPGLEVLPDKSYQFQNLAIGLGRARGRFAKHHLVPFGEYVPMEGVLRGLIEFFDLPMSRSSAGAADQPNLKLSVGEAAMAICYEIAYPESMRLRSENAAVIMTISNDTWFGDSIGPLQHMQIAQMRAVENARWLLRATNNGITGIVNPAGQITAQLPQFEAGVLRGEFELMQGRTPFSYVGHWPVLLLLFSSLVWLVWQRLSARR